MDAANETLAIIEEQGGNASDVALDVTKREQCEALAQSVKGDHGRIDILVNSAGSAHRCSVEDFPEEAFDYIIELNLKGTYLCCQAFGRIMLEQEKGSIINMRPSAPLSPIPGPALSGLQGRGLQVTKALALEWRDRGVRVNGIGPTLMVTPLISRTAAESGSSITADFIVDRMIRKRRGLPKELIGAAVFLGSDARSW